MALSGSFKIPGCFITIILGAGTQSPLDAPKTVLIVDYGTAGHYNTSIPISSAEDAGNEYGYGSHIYLGAVSFFKEYSFGTLFACRYAEASGGVAAAKTLTAVGNPILPGSMFLDINGMDPLEIPINIGDLQGALLQNIVTAVNLNVKYPITGGFVGVGLDCGGVTYTGSDTGVTVTNVAPTTSQATSVAVVSKAITITLGAGGTPVNIGTGTSGLTWIAKRAAVTVTYVDPGTAQAASVATLSGTAITITLKNTTGASVDATPVGVIAAVIAAPSVLALLESAPAILLAPGTGVIVPVGSTALPWGLTATEDMVRIAVLNAPTALALLASIANTTPPGTATATVAGPISLNISTATFTWKQKGARGNQFKLRTSLGGVTGIVFTVTDTVVGINDGNPTTALDSLATADYDFIVTGANTADAFTGITLFTTYVNQRSGPTVGLRGVVIFASLDTYAATVTLALSQNAHRDQLIWCRNADETTIELACKMAAVRSQFEGQDPAWNFDYTQFESFRGPFNPADKISVVEANNGLNNGITSIGFNRQNKAYVWRSITTRFQDANGAPDYRVLDTSKVAVTDYIADFLASDYLAKGFQSMKLRDDSTDSRPIFRVLTPSIVRKWILGILYEAQNQEPIMLENVDKWLDSLIVQISATVPGRIEARVPIDVIEGAHQFDITLMQIG